MNGVYTIRIYTYEDPYSPRREYQYAMYEHAVSSAKKHAYMLDVTEVDVIAPCGKKLHNFTTCLGKLLDFESDKVTEV